VPPENSFRQQACVADDSGDNDGERFDPAVLCGGIGQGADQGQDRVALSMIVIPCSLAMTLDNVI
jgi:hypothetical protein